MRFAYLSKNSNRSGFYILRHLLEESRFRPSAVILPASSSSPLDCPTSAKIEKERYQLEVQRMGGEALRFEGSIPLLLEKHKTPLLRLESIKTQEEFEKIRALQVDLMVLGGGWPQLIPQQVIELPSLGIINTHPSLLPEFRGTDIHR